MPAQTEGEREFRARPKKKEKNFAALQHRGSGNYNRFHGRNRFDICSLEEGGELINYDTSLSVCVLTENLETKKCIFMRED